MTRSYDSINMTNIRNSLHVVQTLVDTHKDDLVVVGMTPGMYSKYALMSLSVVDCSIVWSILLCGKTEYNCNSARQVWRRFYDEFRSPHALLLIPHSSIFSWCINLTKWWYSTWLILHRPYTALNTLSTDSSIPIVTPAPRLSFPTHPILVNEPWDRIPMDVLKDFYWQSYQIVQKGAPHWITLLHDSFRLSVGVCVCVCYAIIFLSCMMTTTTMCCYFLWH